ncbi:YtxH domain-containing protein [Shouchella lonarensis]|uniref:Gas vesicle protein n=1 Tax=Shouchella lonarensis TaxID=1464122 RepID=A0A1G6GGU8_9BACI|nr:YtxH domain-containing protein [Shouchella lonarensis]SDB81217.1 Gas vesicle protein [Shouchella lonarensis]
MGEMNTKDFLIGTLIGGIVGATTALFLAPKSGKELRGDLTEQAQFVKDKTIKLSSDVRDKSGAWIDVAKEKSSALAKTVSDQSQQVAEIVKNVSAAAKESAHKQREETVSLVSDMKETVDDAGEEMGDVMRETGEKVAQEVGGRAK